MRLKFAVPALLLAQLALGCSRAPLKPTQAVCTTDSDCAAWEVRTGVPEADRHYGDPVPSEIILAGGTVYTGPIAHNIPALMPDGTAVWMCETQPRQYWLPNGTTEWTLDHYIVLGKGGCPDVPID